MKCISCGKAGESVKDRTVNDPCAERGVADVALCKDCLVTAATETNHSLQAGTDHTEEADD